MSISMHSAGVAVFVRMLNNMRFWLDKAEAHAELFFHTTMACAPLRQGGVDLGKMDYLGAA